MAVMAGKDGVIKIGENVIGYIDNFSINVNIGSAETSGIGKTWKDFISTAQDWSGSMSGTFDYADLAQKAIVDKYIVATPNQSPLVGIFTLSPTLDVTGSFNATSIGSNITHGDKITISFNFQGTGSLIPAVE